MSFIIILFVITFGRFNSTLLGYEFLNTDEFVIGAKALRLIKNNFNFYEFDGDTSGLLNALFLTWPKIFDLDVSFLSIRISSILVIGLILYFTYKIINNNLDKKLSFIIFLPLLLFFSFSKDADFIHYTNELIATLLIIISFFLIMQGIRINMLKKYFLVGFILSSVLFAKMQFFPVAVIIFMTVLINQYLKTKNFKTLIVLLLGFSSPIVLVSIYYFLNQNFIDLFYNVIHYPLSDLITRNLSSDQIIADTNSLIAIKNSNKLNILIEHLKLNAVFHLIYFYALILIFFLFYIKKINLLKKGINFELILVAVSIFSSLIISLVTGSVHRHYLIVLLPMIPIFISFFIKFYQRHLEFNKNFIIFLAPLYSIFIISLILENSKFYSKKFKHVNYFDNKINFSNPNILEFLNLEKRDKIIVWGWKPELYILSGLSPAARDTVNQKQIDYKSKREYFRKRFISDFEKNNPTLVVDYVKPNGYMFTQETQNVESFPDLTYLLKRDFKKINTKKNNCPDFYLKNNKAEIFYKKKLNFTFQNTNKDFSKINDLGIDEDICETSIILDETFPNKINVNTYKKKVSEIMFLASKKNELKVEIKLKMYFEDQTSRNDKIILNKYPFWSKLKVNDKNNITNIEFDMTELKKRSFGINELKIYKN